MAKKFKHFGVALFSAAVLTAAASHIVPAVVPVLGAQVVHANDAAYTTVSVQMNGYDYSQDPDGTFIETLDEFHLYNKVPVGEPYELTLPNFEGYEFHGWNHPSPDVLGELVYGNSQTISFDRIPEGGYDVMAFYAKIQPSTDQEGDQPNPKDPGQDPAGGGNANTGGGDNAGGDTQTPPTDNGVDVGSDTQTPPTGSGTGTQTPPADSGTDDAGVDTSTPPTDAPKTQTLTVVETRQDENGAVLFTKTHSLVLSPGEEKDLDYNPDREILVRGGNLYRYGNFEDGATLYFTTRLKPAVTNTDPANGGNANTGGGDNAGGDTQTPPTDNGVDVGSDTQTPPTGSGTGTQTPPADSGTDDAGVDTSTPPTDAPKTQTLTVVETRQDENGASKVAASNASKTLPSTGEGSSILQWFGGLITIASGLILAGRKKGAR